MAEIVQGRVSEACEVKQLDEKEVGRLRGSGNAVFLYPECLLRCPFQSRYGVGGSCSC